MAKITTAPAEHTLEINEQERLALLSALRYRKGSGSQAQYGDISLHLINILQEA